MIGTKFDLHYRFVDFRFLCFVAIFVAIVLPSTLLCSQEPGKASRQEEADYPLAQVGEAKVMASTVNRYVSRIVGDKTLSEVQLEAIRKESLQHFINRELAKSYLTNRGYKATDGQVQIEIDLLTASLEQVGKTLDQHLEGEERTLEDIQSEIRWKINWQTYLEKTLTNEVLENYFDRNRRQFDGTEIKVAQILLAVDDTADSVLQKAKEIKTDVVSGKTTWKTAVEQNSIAASKTNGGEVGWIRFKEPMPVEFSRRAFALEIGEVSDPFVSGFGVHLIRCLEVKPGSSDFGDVREQVKMVATKDLFNRIANLQRSEVNVELAK